MMTDLNYHENHNDDNYPYLIMKITMIIMQWISFGHENHKDYDDNDYHDNHNDDNDDVHNLIMTITIMMMMMIIMIIRIMMMTWDSAHVEQVLQSWVEKAEGEATIFSF